MVSSVCVPVEEEHGTTTGTGIHASPNVMKSYRAELGPDPVLISEESVDVAGDLHTETEGERGKMELSSVLTASNVVEEEVRSFRGGGGGGVVGHKSMV